MRTCQTRTYVHSYVHGAVLPGHLMLASSCTDFGTKAIDQILGTSPHRTFFETTAKKRFLSILATRFATEFPCAPWRLLHGGCPMANLPAPRSCPCATPLPLHNFPALSINLSGYSDQPYTIHSINLAATLTQSCLHLACVW